MKKTDIDLNDLFSRGVADFIDPEGKFKEKIQKKLEGKYPKDIVIKFGVDPTRPDIHLGHAVILRKLRKFQDLGCKVIFLVGDFTAHIGDPTGKSKVRPELDQKEIEINMKSYLDQVGKILLTDPKVFSWTRNSDWLVSINDILAPENTTITLTQKGKSVTTDPLPGNDIFAKAMHWMKTRMQKGKISNYTLITLLSILRRITFNRLIERDMFQDRIKNGEPVFMHEMMYPVIQGIDSDAIANIYGSCDLEVGGSDQTFNMLVGRDVMTMNKKEPQAVMSFKILEGLDGKVKMSKSLDNYITINENPNEMFGKIMSIPDTSIINYFELCTFEPADEIADIKKSIAVKNPKDFKVRLAKEIIAIYHGEKASASAEDNFIKVFQNKEIPEDMPEFKANKGEVLSEFLVANKILKSKSEFSRLIEEKAIHDLDSGESISDLHFKIEKNTKLKIGKKRFLKISL